MKKYTKIAVAAVLASIPMTGYGALANVAVANCKQTANAAQNIKCGINAPVNMNISGSGTVNINNPVQCAVTAILTVNQQAQCTAIAGKAGDVQTFKPTELPQRANTDLFNLGQIKMVRKIPQIDAPTVTGNGVMFSFVTDAGLPINFLIKRTNFTLDMLNALGTETPADATYKARLQSLFPKDGSPMLLTWYYRLIPGIELKWTEIWTDLDSPKNDSFAPTFNASIAPNGLVTLTKNANKDPQTKQFFFIGDYPLKPTDESLPVPPGTTPTQIPIGGGKFASPKDL